MGGFLLVAHIGVGIASLAGCAGAVWAILARRQDISGFIEIDWGFDRSERVVRSVEGLLWVKTKELLLDRVGKKVFD